MRRKEQRNRKIYDETLPDFLKGAGSVIDLYGISSEPCAVYYTTGADKIALGEDWKEIGNDLKKSMNELFLSER